jgi:tetratricopeptide (TPR) repeat protein
MRSLGVVLGQMSHRSQAAEVPPLPPRDLSPVEATRLGWRLLDVGDAARAIPYLIVGLHGRETAFAWTQLGKALRDRGWPQHAIECYERALRLEPGNRFALCGRAMARTEWSSSTEDLVSAFYELSPLASDDNPLPVLRTISRVLTELSRRFPNPAMTANARSFRLWVDGLDSRSSMERQQAIQERLQGALIDLSALQVPSKAGRVSRGLTGDAAQARLRGRRADTPTLEQGRAERLRDSRKRLPSGEEPL